MFPLVREFRLSLKSKFMFFWLFTDDFNLALLMSQIGGNEVTRSLMKQQLNQWHESEADQLIDVGRLKIMTLIAGHMLYISSKGIINTCENLDWKRAFALHLWYFFSFCSYREILFVAY